jgi:phosphoribosylamine--glycine ligase
MQRHGIPTAPFQVFDDIDTALRFVGDCPWDYPIVVKADGLAAGKGVVICDDAGAAAATVRAAMDEAVYGRAGERLVVEAFVQGVEATCMALSDGSEGQPLLVSQDHKAAHDGDRGPNTGGMGAYAPATQVLDEAAAQRVFDEILEPTIAGMAAEDRPFSGALYCGLMLTDDGPQVLEFNCRFGDPEAQVVLPAVRADLAEHCWRVAAGEPWSPRERLPAERAVVTTVIAAGGYPEAPHQGAVITIPDHLPEATLLFHAGTSRDAGGTLRAAGGRVLCATGLGDTVAEAAMRSRQLAAAVSFEGAQYRRDIAWREVARAGAS